MQSLTATPRDGFTETQIRNLLVAPDLDVDYGAELLDASLNLISDISSDLSGGVVHRVMAADIHGTCELTISQELAWGRDRVRPYMTLSSATAGVSGCRFRQGAYLMTTPDTAIGETPQTYSVTGYDVLHILQNPTGDTYAANAGTPVLAMVRSFITAAGVLSPVLLDSTAETATLTTDMVWALTSSDAPTWLRIVNDLLASVGYRGLWADADGNLRSGPYILPDQRASEWRFDVGDLVKGIVAQDRSVVADLWNIPNWFRVVRNGMTTEPVELAGRHTMANGVNGPSSYASVGRFVRAPVVFVDATSQADLIVQGERLFAAATRVSEVITLRMSPFPAAGHFDRVTYADAALGADRESQCRSWSLPLDGSDMTYVIESL